MWWEKKKSIKFPWLNTVCQELLAFLYLKYLFQTQLFSNLMNVNVCIKNVFYQILFNQIMIIIIKYDHKTLY